MFEIGNKVVYPMHGAGVIIEIEQQEYLGKECPYYVIRLLNNEMQVMLPVEKADQLGLRCVNGMERLKDVYVVLAGCARVLPENWNHRYRSNMEKLKTGRIQDMAEVIKDLYLRDREKGLSTGEKKMLENALEILISEISLSSEMDRADVRRELLSCMQE